MFETEACSLKEDKRQITGGCGVKVTDRRQKVSTWKGIGSYQPASGRFASQAESIFFSILQVIDLPSIPKYNPFH